MFNENEFGAAFGDIPLEMMMVCDIDNNISQINFQSIYNKIKM